MSSTKGYISRLLPFFLTCLALTSCAGKAGQPADAPEPGPAAAAEPSIQPASTEALLGSGFPPAPPLDAKRPWEELDAAGKVIPMRNFSSLNASSEFVPGVERESSFGLVSDNGEASSLSSGVSGGRQASFALYRLALAGQEPGVLALDLNLHPRSGGSGPSSYYVGLSCYSDGVWEWRGPFSDGQLRLSTGGNVGAGASYLSPLGNMYIAVAGYDGANFDIVGLGANPRDAADTTAPASPGGLTATPVAGGLELQWNALLAADLAGYRVYYRSSVFANSTEPGVRHLDYLEGSTRLMLSGVAAGTHVRISALDISGNESPLSNDASASPLAGSAPALIVSTSLVSGRVGASGTLSVSGADSYDVDLDGDGTFDTIGSSATSYPIDTSQPGIIRPRVRASSSGGSAVALGSVSLIIAANFPPTARLTVSPTSSTIWAGETLTVFFDASASTDDGGTAGLQYAYDPQGDGTFSAFSTADTTNKPYSAPGVYQGAVIVKDAEGLESFAYAVETVRQASGFDTRIADGRTGAGPRIVAAMINGNPAVAYSSNGSGGLSYARALDPRGEQWAPAVDITAVPDNLMRCGLASIAGHPAIAYYDNAASTIRYLRAADATGQSFASWSATPADVISPVATSSVISLVEVNGQPAIAWQAFGFGHYKRATGTGEQTSQWSVTTFDFATGNCDYLKMQMVSGRPAIAYIGNNQQRYVRSTTANGDTVSSWPASSLLLSGTDEVHSGYVGFAVVAGRPAVAYVRNDAVLQTIRYTRATTASGGNLADWPATVPITSIPLDYYAPSLADVDGKPGLAITCPSAGFYTCHFTIGLDAAGSSWTAIQRATTLSLGYQDDGNNSIVSGPGWCGIATSISGGSGAEFNTLQYN